MVFRQGKQCQSQRLVDVIVCRLCVFCVLCAAKLVYVHNKNKNNNINKLWLAARCCLCAATVPVWVSAARANE